LVVVILKVELAAAYPVGVSIFWWIKQKIGVF